MLKDREVKRKSYENKILLLLFLCFRKLTETVKHSTPGIQQLNILSWEKDELKQTKNTTTTQPPK